MGVILALDAGGKLKGSACVDQGGPEPGSGKGLVCLVKNVLKVTLCFEGAGVVLSYLVFSRGLPAIRALGISLFHSVFCINNSGFDILGGLKNLTG